MFGEAGQREVLALECREHPALIFGGAFTVIIAVNLVLALSAVRTFPGLEVRNSYVASQSFDADRTAQVALGWDVSATIYGSTLQLQITKQGAPVRPEIISATFGRATTVAQDQSPVFAFDGQIFKAYIDAGPGNWNLRLVAEAADGTRFQQRIIVGHGS